MGNKPLISIITVCYNAATTIEKTILSIINQTYSNIEYIIIDGKSTDGTIDIINGYNSHISTIISEKDNGIYDAMNKAFKIANGDFIIFINAGDILLSNNTIEIVSYFIKDKDIVYYGDVLFKNYTNSIKFYGNKFTHTRLMKENICHQSIFYPKSMYKTSYYNLKYKLLADWEYNIRHFKSIKFQHIPIIISIYDTNGLSSMNEDFVFTKERPNIIKKYWGIHYRFLYICIILKIKIINIWKIIKKE